MQRFRSLGLWVLTLVAGGCGAVAPEDHGVTFEAAAAVYAPGDTIEAELRNEGKEEATYNFCFTSLDRREGASWKVLDWSIVAPTHGVTCLTIGLALAPGGAATLRALLPPHAEGGEYRLRTFVSVYGFGLFELPTRFTVNPD